MISNKLISQLTRVFSNGYMTYPQFKLSYISDQKGGTIGMLDWDNNTFTLNVKYNFYKEAKSELIKNNIKHDEGEMEAIHLLYGNKQVTT